MRGTIAVWSAVLSVIWVGAILEKAAYPCAFIASAGRLAPSGLQDNTIALGVIVLEGLAAALLALGWARSGGALGASLIAVFTVLLWLHGDLIPATGCKCLPFVPQSLERHGNMNLILVLLHIGLVGFSHFAMRREARTSPIPGRASPESGGAPCAR